MSGDGRAALRAAVALSRALRRRGIRASQDRSLMLLEALGEVQVSDREAFRAAALATLTSEPEERAVFDQVFDRFWDGATLEPGEEAAEHGESDPRMPSPQHGGESLPSYRADVRSGSLVDGDPQRARQDVPSAGTSGGRRGGRRGDLAAWSPEDSEGEAERIDLARDELGAVRRLAEELREGAPMRRSRRARPSVRGGRLDLRRTVRSSLRTDGELLRPAWTAPSLRPRRIVFLCDVSGSMARYSRVLLASLKAATEAGAKTEAFVFATRLTRVTAELRRRDVERALEDARGSVADWSGGTRIGDVLCEFNRTHARLGLARGAVAVVVSDGWDRGDPDLLSSELGRLALQARTLVWLNPRAGDPAEQPLAVGLRAALPHVDEFVPGHDARAVAGLGSLIAGVGSARRRALRPRVDSTRR